MKSRTITVRGVPDAVLRSLRSAAERGRRSLNSELLVILERAAGAAPEGMPSVGAAVRETVVAPYQARPVAPRLSLDRARLGELCRRHHIHSLALFGSVLRADFGAASDVDVLVEFEPGMTPGFGLIAVEESLSELLGGRRVDLVTRRGLHPRLRDAVLRTAEVVYAAR
jgi:hypothetical protein